LSSSVTTQVAGPQLRRPARRHGLMHLLMLCATFCWAANIVAGKEALRGFGPTALAMLRVVGAALVFGLLFLVRRKRLPVGLGAREWRLMALVAACGVAFNQLLFISGLARSSVAHAGLITSLIPVMVLVLSCLMRLEALTVLKFVGMLVSFTGVAILTTSKMGQGNGAHWQGDLILLGGGVVFAYYTILVKEVADRYDPLTLNAVTFGLGTALMIPFGARPVLQVQWAALPAVAWGGLAFMVVFGSVVAYLIYALALTELAASRVAAFSYLQPVIATGLGIWLLAEKLTWRVVFSGVLILLGVYLAERERGEEQGVGSRE